MNVEPNLLRTRHLTLSTTHQVTEHLADLARTGLWGRDATETAERLITDQIRRLIREKPHATSERKTIAVR